MKSDLYEMMYKLAERGLNKSLAGEGSQESRAVALLLSAIDQLATAATLDESLSQSVKEAIDILRLRVEEQAGGKKRSPDKSEDWMKEGREEDGQVKPSDKKEEKEEEEEDGG